MLVRSLRRTVSVLCSQGTRTTLINHGQTFLRSELVPFEQWLRCISRCSFFNSSSTSRTTATTANPTRHSLSETESRILGTSTNFKSSPLGSTGLRKPPSSLPKVSTIPRSQEASTFTPEASTAERSAAPIHPDGTENVPGTCVRAPGRLSVQESYEPHGYGFGGGPTNPYGLHLRSYRIEGGLESEWTAAEYHQAFPGVVAGGIVGCILECQGNWTAALALMDGMGLRFPPLTVTGTYSIYLASPTPVGEPIKITSRVLDIKDNRKVTVEVTLHKQDNLGNYELCAKGEGIFVKVGAMRDIRADRTD